MPRKSRKNVGLIGLGIIGARVATGLRSAGFQVFVWNRSAKPAPNFLGSPAEVAEACEIIQIFVSDAAALLDVIEAMGEFLGPRHVIICNATVGPESVLEAAKLVMDRGAKFLDAPFTGSKSAAEKKQLVYYIGGDEATYLRAKPVLEATSKAIVRIGGIGHASTVKVVTNMISAVSIQTLAEALAIVQKAGLDPEVLGLALEHNACRSGVIELKLQKMVAGDYDPHFSLKHMFKDVQLGIHLANGLNIEIPATTVTAGVMYGAINQGWADLDFCALYKAYAPEGQTAAITAPEKREAAPALPDSGLKDNGGELAIEKQRPPFAATPLLHAGEPPILADAKAKGPGNQPREERPAVSTETGPPSSTGKPEDGKDEAAKIIEAVIAEFRDVPLKTEPAPVTSRVSKGESSFNRENAIGNGADVQGSRKTVPRRVNFVKRWFVSRAGGS